MTGTLGSRGVCSSPDETGQCSFPLQLQEVHPTLLVQTDVLHLSLPLARGGSKVVGFLSLGQVTLWRGWGGGSEVEGVGWREWGGEGGVKG